MNIPYNQTGKCINIVIWSIILSCFSAFAQEPEGQLYWKVDGDTSGFFSLYDPNDPATPHYGTKTYGAYSAVDNACEASPGNGTYIDSNKVKFVIFLPARFEGYCRILTGGLFPFETNGNLYKAFLYCNGVVREDSDTSLCPVPPAQLVDENNLGIPCEEFEE